MIWGPRVGDHGDSEGGGVGDKDNLPSLHPQVWREAQAEVWAPRLRPWRALLPVLEGDLGNQLPALAVHLVREALVTAGTPSEAALPGRPARPAQTRPVSSAGALGVAPSQASLFRQEPHSRPTSVPTRGSRPVPALSVGTPLGMGDVAAGEGRHWLTGWSRSSSGSNLVTRWWHLSSSETFLGNQRTSQRRAGGRARVGAGPMGGMAPRAAPPGVGGAGGDQVYGEEEGKEWLLVLGLRGESQEDELRDTAGLVDSFH